MRELLRAPQRNALLLLLAWTVFVTVARLGLNTRAFEPGSWRRHGAEQFRLDFYWRSVRDLHPAETAAKLKQPMLILQGDRDYQVPLADLAAWKYALTDRPNVTLKSYPKLNHLFMEGAGKSRPAEYEREGHVDAEAVDDVARWVKER